jgi:hypothetical protein
VSDTIHDPLEERLRRTFDERGEDMAPGDAVDLDRELQRVAYDAGTTAFDDGHAGGNGSRRPGRLLLAAAIVVIVGAAVAAVGVVAAGRDGDGRGGDDGEPSGVAHEGDGDPAVEGADLAIATRSLVTALEDERNLASLELMGMTDVIDAEIDDPAEARSRTDAAIAALRLTLGDGPEASAYQEAMDGLGGLAALRGDIDADVGPHDLDDIGHANDVFARYAALASALLDAEGEVALANDDPELRSGAEVHQLGLRQQELTGQLVRAVLLFAIEPGTTSTSDVARLDLLVRQGREDLVAAAEGTPYEEPTRTVIGQIDDSGLLDLVDAALNTATIDVAGVLQAVELPVGEGWPGFLTQVEEILHEQE